MPDTSSTLRGCPHCGLVQRVPMLSVGQEARCPRCGQTVVKPGAASSNQLCAAIALAALICYPLGISLPVLRIEQLGHSHEASIWGGSVALVTGGHLAIGLIVLLIIGAVIATVFSNLLLATIPFLLLAIGLILARFVF